MKQASHFQKAQIQYLAAFGRFFLNITNLKAFLGIVGNAIEKGRDEHRAEWEQGARKAASESKLKSLMGYRLDALPSGMMTDFSNALADRSIRLASQTVESAGIVFAHSILDGLLAECCMISFNATPNDWFHFIRKQKIELESLNQKSTDALQHDAAEKFVRQLERESIAKKLQSLHQICGPKLEPQKLPTANIDFRQIEQLDSLRHRIVHGKSFSIKIRGAEKHAFFVSQAGMAIFVLLNEAYDFSSNEDFSAISHMRFLRGFAAIKKEFPELMTVFEKYANKMPSKFKDILTTSKKPHK